MERIKIKNGNTKSFITTENDYYKFYYCETNQEARDLKETLKGEIGEDNHTWFVRVRKDD